MVSKLQAIEEYSKAIELDPNVPTYYCNRAMAYIKLEGHLPAPTCHSKIFTSKLLSISRFKKNLICSPIAFGAAVIDATKAIELDNNCVKVGRTHLSLSTGSFDALHPNLS